MIILQRIPVQSRAVRGGRFIFRATCSIQPTRQPACPPSNPLKAAWRAHGVVSTCVRACVYGVCTVCVRGGTLTIRDLELGVIGNSNPSVLADVRVFVAGVDLGVRHRCENSVQYSRNQSRRPPGWSVQIGASLGCRSNAYGLVTLSRDEERFVDPGRTLAGSGTSLWQRM